MQKLVTVFLDMGYRYSSLQRSVVISNPTAALAIAEAMMALAARMARTMNVMIYGTKNLLKYTVPHAPKSHVPKVQEFYFYQVIHCYCRILAYL